MTPNGLAAFFFSTGQGLLRLVPERFFALSEVVNLPTPDHTYRGAMARRQAGAGVADGGPAFAAKRANGSIEWDTLALASQTQPLDADLSAIAGLVDPAADRILFWDDSAGAYTHLTPGTGLSITGTTLNAEVTPATTVTVTLRQSSVGGIAAGATGQAVASCNSGEKATGGGCEMSGASSTQFEGDAGIGSYLCRMRNDTGSGQAITAKVYCLTVG